ncbi:MAG TPA: choice-of-anchor tandem repeat GloVer-containing protein [Rhizomicrobium sp.]|nr:choice-of-anchor tandem repeat GloVer-containing protein [Rhizomicrobium sp.]
MHIVRHFRLALLSATVAFAFAADIESAQAWKYKTLHTYTDSNFATDGYGPDGLLWDAASGSLYGVTTYGGDRCPNDNYGGCGVLFQMTADGTETVLHRFEGRKDGMYPQGGLIKDDAGNIYGTTTRGGKSNFGTIFKQAPDGTYTVIHAFEGGDNGEYPDTRLIWDRTSGQLYGMAYYTAFKITPEGKYSLWHQFDGSFAYLATDAQNHVYGVTQSGGDERCNCGTVFTLNPQGDETLLYTFTRRSFGFPSGPPVIDGRGDLFGAGYGNHENGSLFELSRKGVFSVRHKFHETGASHPSSELVLDASGSLYGATACYSPGSSPCIIFENSLRKNFQILYTFDEDKVALEPLIADETGNLFGTMYIDDKDHSEVFELVK